MTNTSKNILFIGNQGGPMISAFYAEMARGLGASDPRHIKCHFVGLLKKDKCAFDQNLKRTKNVSTFEEFVEFENSSTTVEEKIDLLNKKYPKIDWCLLLAAERSFSDYCMSMGGIGNRIENEEYKIELIFNLVKFFDNAFDCVKPHCVVTQTGDTLFSLIAIKISQQRNIIIKSVVPAWLLPQNEEGGFFAYDEFLHNKKMEDQYRSRLESGNLELAQQKIEDFVKAVYGFSGETSFYKSHSRGLVKTLSPKIHNLIPYILQEYRRDKRSYYQKISPIRKLYANYLRLYRGCSLQRVRPERDLNKLPRRFIFFAFHMQPEQSTLTQAPWYTNQIALVENISKAMPLGYTLVVKLHPVGEFMRPPSHFRYLENFSNVKIFDCFSKDLILKSSGVITITGTVGAEAVILGRPLLMFGRSFYDFCDNIIKINCYSELPSSLKELIRKPTLSEFNSREHIRRCFIEAYLASLIPRFPTIGNGGAWGKALADELISEKFDNVG